jgi:hypothetical protein
LSESRRQKIVENYPRTGLLATHVLKITGSYEQASYAIQDTPEMVAKHYGRFPPQNRATLLAQILNKVWAAA